MKNTAIAISQAMIKIFFLLIVFDFSLSAQKKSYPKKEYVAPDSTFYWNKDLPLYIRLASNPDDAGTLLGSKEHAQYVNPIYLDTEGPNFIRTRYAVDKETKKVILPKIEVLMEVVSDASAPLTSISFLHAPVHHIGAEHYYGPGLNIDLKSHDNLSGVAGIDYAMDGDNFLSYTNEISVNIEGKHVFSFAAVDNVGNTENTHSHSFTVDLSAPQVTHNVNGIADNNNIAGSSKIYFTATDNYSGVSKIFYRFDSTSFKLYNSDKVDFYSLTDGDHTMEYYAIDNVKNESIKYKFDFYYDKTAPITAADVLGDRYLVEDRVYFSGRTKMKLTAVDNKIGIKEILYSVDDKPFIAYDQPFYLPSVQGNHTIKFYSVDRLSNAPTGAESYKHNLNLVYLDLTGPEINYSYQGALFNALDKLYISPVTKINLTATDKESGLQYISYSVDKAAAETKYSQGFSIPNTGEHTLELFGYDNVNNRNTKQTTVYVDAEAPQIYTNFSSQSIGEKEGLKIYPSYATLFLAATDELIGNDKIYYQLNDKSEISYDSPIGNFARNTKYTIKIRALDKVGNESKQTIEFYTSEK